MARKNKNGQNHILILHTMKLIRPITQNQHETFKAFDDGKNLLLHGYSGTGKSLVGMYLALSELSEPDTTYHKIYLIRSAVPARDIGFMPGTMEEKLDVYEAPYRAICRDILDKPTSYNELKKAGLIEFTSTSYMRGMTFENCIVIVDEIQNCDWGELATIITRIGKNCRVIFIGDFRQSDFRGHETNSKNDVHKFMNVLKSIEDFAVIEFDIEDIVRSKLVKQFIVLSNKMGYE